MSTLPQLDSTLGACLIGSQINAMLYGLTTLQSYFCLVSFPEDLRETKVLVCVIWILDSLHTALVLKGMYYYLITNYDNPSGLAIVHWSISASLGVHTLLVLIVQSFFTARIFRLASSRVRWWLTTIVGISVVGHLAFGIEALTLIIIKKEFAKMSKLPLSAVIPYAGFALFSDVLIAGSLCVLLYGSRTGFRKTNTIVNTLIIYAINRCLLTSVVTLLEMIMFLFLRGSLWFCAIAFLVGKLYANSLLAHLNSRHTIRALNGSLINSTDLTFGAPTELTSNTRPKTDTGAIVVDIRVESDSQSSETQSHLSAKHRMSTVSPYNTASDNS